MPSGRATVQMARPHHSKPRSTGFLSRLSFARWTIMKSRKTQAHSTVPHERATRRKTERKKPARSPTATTSERFRCVWGVFSTPMIFAVCYTKYMKKVSKKEMTIEDLAGMVKHGFDGVYERMDKMEVDITEVKQNVHFLRANFVNREEFDNVLVRLKFLERRVGVKAGH